MREHETAPVDAFELPEWLGVEPVTWAAEGHLGTHHVKGTLQAGAGRVLECDVLACDLAYPLPVLTEKWRSAAHQAWALGEALLLGYDGRMTVVAPGTEVGVDTVLEALRRLVRAVGGSTERFTVLLRL